MRKRTVMEESEKSDQKKNKRKVFRVIGYVVLVVVFAAIAYGVCWINDTYQPDDQAVAAMESDDSVTVTKTEDGLLVFEPESTPTTGFIFYPGGLVEPEAYAPLCKEIARQGYLVVITPMKLNLAILSPNQADEVIDEYDEIETWVIGGHSLGGVMACSYAASHEEITGLVLYAAYPQSDELEDSDVSVLSLYGSDDGVADLTKVEDAVLSENSKIIAIGGGNHSFFGSYGLQNGDNEGSLGWEKQQELAVTLTVEFLEGLDLK